MLNNTLTYIIQHENIISLNFFKKEGIKLKISLYGIYTFYSSLLNKFTIEECVEYDLLYLNKNKQEIYCKNQKYLRYYLISCTNNHLFMQDFATHPLVVDIVNEFKYHANLKRTDEYFPFELTDEEIALIAKNHKNLETPFIFINSLYEYRDDKNFEFIQKWAYLLTKIMFMINNLTATELKNAFAKYETTENHVYKYLEAWVKLMHDNYELYMLEINPNIKNLTVGLTIRDPSMFELPTQVLKVDAQKYFWANDKMISLFQVNEELFNDKIKSNAFNCNRSMIQYQKYLLGDKSVNLNDLMYNTIAMYCENKPIDSNFDINVYYRTIVCSGCKFSLFDRLIKYYKTDEVANVDNRIIIKNVLKIYQPYELTKSGTFHKFMSISKQMTKKDLHEKFVNACLSESAN